MNYQKPTLKSSLCLLAIIILIPCISGQDWQSVLSEAQGLFSNRTFGKAAEKYLLAAELAREAGEVIRRAEIYSDLARCYQEGRLDDEALFIKYTNTSAYWYLEGARESGFTQAGKYLRRATYLLHFSNLSEASLQMTQIYRQRCLDQAKSLVQEADGLRLEGEWKEAGEKYLNASMILYTLEEPTASNIFGLASESFSRQAEELGSILGELSTKARCLELAGITAAFNGSNQNPKLKQAADYYFQAAEALQDAGSQSQEKSREMFSSAGEIYRRLGDLNSSKRSYQRSANISLQLASQQQFTKYLSYLKAAKAYDKAGFHTRAQEIYANSMNSLRNVPIFRRYNYLDLFEILGHGRQINWARDSARSLMGIDLGNLSYHGAPSFGGYDIMLDAAPEVLGKSKRGLYYRALVSQNLLLASALVMNNRPLEAKGILDQFPEEILIVDPPNKALHGLLNGIIDLQTSRSEGEGNDLEISEMAAGEIFFDDFCRALQEVLPKDGFAPRCRRVYGELLETLMQASSYGESIDTRYIEANEILQSIRSSMRRNVTQHLEISNIYNSIAWRLVYMGQINGTQGNQAFQAFGNAAYHACAGEDFQKAMLYRSLSAGCIGGDTPLTAAVYVVSESMIEDNQTLRQQALEYISANLSEYMNPEQVSVLLSVLEDRTEFDSSEDPYRMISILVIGAFVLVTSYVLLIWEPGMDRAREEPEPEREDEVQGERESTREELEEEVDDQG